MNELFLKGGFLMYPIFLCSIVAVAIFIERLIYLTIVERRNKKFLSKALKIKSENKLQEINELSHEIKSPISILLSTAIENINRPPEERNVILQQIGSLQIRELEKNIGILSMIAHITPLLGLLGTVIGMIKCFRNIEIVGGEVNPTMLAGGIWEALLTTVAGLSVAIPTLIFYHFLESKVDNIIGKMKNVAIYFPEVFSKYEITSK